MRRSKSLPKGHDPDQDPCRVCGAGPPSRWPGGRCSACWDLLVEARRERITKGPTALYRLHSTDSYLLYLGISVDPKRRFKEHRKTTWWAEVDPELTTIEWLDCNGRAAEEIEEAAIRAEFPWYNRVGVNEPVAELWELPTGCPPHPSAVEYRSEAHWWTAWELWWAAARDCMLNPEERAARDSAACLCPTASSAAGHGTCRSGYSADRESSG